MNAKRGESGPSATSAKTLLAVVAILPPAAISCKEWIGIP